MRSKADVMRDLTSCSAAIGDRVAMIDVRKAEVKLLLKRRAELEKELKYHDDGNADKAAETPSGTDN
jgi:hypothetical protein